MTDKQPTQEQIKEFWEWCGFRLYEDKRGKWKGCFYWHNPPNTKEWGATWLPEPDPNNLFEYAVPAVNQKLDRHISLYQSTNGWTCNIGLGDYEAEDKDPDLALFWAIWEVKGMGLTQEQRKLI